MVLRTHSRKRPILNGQWSEFLELIPCLLDTLACEALQFVLMMGPGHGKYGLSPPAHSGPDYIFQLKLKRASVAVSHPVGLRH